MNIEKVGLDTNVLISANSRFTYADERCQLSCVKMITHVRMHEIVVLDYHNLILDEHCKHLKFSGGPGLGDEFFRFINLDSAVDGLKTYATR